MGIKPEMLHSKILNHTFNTFNEALVTIKPKIAPQTLRNRLTISKWPFDETFEINKLSSGDIRNLEITLKKTSDNKTKSIIYLISLCYENELILKIGVTKNFKKRIEQFHNQRLILTKKYLTEKVSKEKGTEIERNILKHFENERKKGPIHMDGKNEIFIYNEDTAEKIAEKIRVMIKS